MVKYTIDPSNTFNPHAMEKLAQFDQPDRSLRESVKAALQPAALLRSVFASATIWLLMASAMPSYSRLVFQDRLAGYFTAGLGIVLVSQIITLLITAFFSSDHATLVIPQSPTAVIQGMIAGSVMAAAPSDMSLDALFALVHVMIVLSAVLTGGFLVLLGYARAGGLIRYIPYPIVGGFMAGLGWLILNAGFTVMTDLRLNLESLPLLLEGAVLARWLPAAVFALCVLALQARAKSLMVMPGVIILSFILFYAWVYFGLGNVDVLAGTGWFLPDVSGAIPWHAPDFAALARIDQSMIAASAGGIVTLIAVCTLNLFFRASAQELVVDRELDFNRECTVNGSANLAAALSGGGIVAYHAPASTALVHEMRIYGRLVAVILSFMFLLTLFFGSALFSLVPRFIPAGLLMFFGLQFLKEWLVDSWSRLPRQEYAVVVVISLVTAFFGLLTGIAVGIVVAVTFFVFEYSRMQVIKQEFYGAFHRSNLDRSFAQNQMLQTEGDKILILRLQGFIFFGTAYGFYEHVKLRITERAADPVKYLILDFKAVRGFDYSTVQDFKKLKRFTDRHGIDLLLSQVLPHLQLLLADGGIAERKPDQPPLFDDLDHALEWCENALLADADLLDSVRVTVEEQLAHHAMIESRDVSALHSYLQRIETQVGDTVFAQDDASDDLYFIETGRVDVLLRLPDESLLRLRSMTAGAVIGEVGFYLNKARGASVVVTEAGALQRLSHGALQRMEESDPQTASAIHILISCVLADRLSSSNRVIQELLD